MSMLEQFLPTSDSKSVAQGVLPASMFATIPVLLHGDITQENILGSSASVTSAVKSVDSSNGVDLTTHLNAIGCGKYVPLLVEQEELTMESLAIVDEAHLKDLGIPLGPRLSILKNAGGRDKLGAAATAEDEEMWETCSSSSSDSSDDEDEDDESSAALQAKRQSKFLGPHEWTPSFVIDFADVKTGDPLYDLVAVFFAALVRRCLRCRSSCVRV